MNQKPFTIEERCLREYYVKGKSYRENARFLGRNIGCIFREIMRNKTFMNKLHNYVEYVSMGGGRPFLQFHNALMAER